MKKKILLLFSLLLMMFAVSYAQSTSDLDKIKIFGLPTRCLNIGEILEITIGIERPYDASNWAEIVKTEPYGYYWLRYNPREGFTIIPDYFEIIENSFVGLHVKVVGSTPISAIDGCLVVTVKDRRTGQTRLVRSGDICIY